MRFSLDRIRELNRLVCYFLDHKWQRQVSALGSLGVGRYVCARYGCYVMKYGKEEK